MTLRSMMKLIIPMAIAALAANASLGVSYANDDRGHHEDRGDDRGHHGGDDHHDDHGHGDDHHNS